jgi:hypothetical protein
MAHKTRCDKTLDLFPETLNDDQRCQHCGRWVTTRNIVAGTPYCQPCVVENIMRSNYILRQVDLTGL